MFKWPSSSSAEADDHELADLVEPAPAPNGSVIYANLGQVER